MFSTTKTFGHDLGLSCCFRQWRATHSHCRFLHGYAIAVTLVIKSTQLDERNWCFDFGGFKGVKEFLVRTFDHKLIVAKDDPQLEYICGMAGLDLADPLVLDNVGCEAFARFIHNECAEIIKANSGSRATLYSVEVREHGANSSTYTPHP